MTEPHRKYNFLIGFFCISYSNVIAFPKNPEKMVKSKQLSGVFQIFLFLGTNKLTCLFKRLIEISPASPFSPSKSQMTLSSA